VDRWPEFAERVLGACELQADCSWGHRLSSVLRIRDASGATWYLKHHADQARYQAEVAAYREWIPALQDAAPRLRAADDSLQAVILSAVPGDTARWPATATFSPGTGRPAERDLHRAAGNVLRRLHDAREAFLAGYGQDLRRADRQILHGCAVLTGVWLLIKAHDTRQPSFEDASRAALLRILERGP
jgi:hypothetical protein